jgi:DNA-binding GntR family transcriptional regulator
MAPGRRQLFIYWRVAPAEVPVALQALRAWQAELCAQHPSLQCRLYQRHDGSQHEATVMESYARAVPGVDEALRQHIEHAGTALLQRWLRGPRHVEVFDALPDPGD